MLSSFLEELFEHGRIHVRSPESECEIDTKSSLELLHAEEARWRLHLPSGLPDFMPNVANQAAIQLYRAAQFLVYRDTETDFMEAALQPLQPGPQTPADHYSADVCFRYMHDALRLSTAASENDPLNEVIRRAVKDWPLSAVGLGIEHQRDHIPFDNKALRLMYLERVLERRDMNIMNLPSVRKALQELAGVNRHLLPATVNATD